MSAPPKPAVVKAQTSLVEEMATGSSYVIMRKVSIASDGKPHKVTVNHVDLTVTFEYICLPTKTSNCYLRAIATNNSQLTLLQGPLNIFMNNYFITKSSLSLTNPKETLKLYLGMDQGIKVDFQPIEKIESTQSSIFGKKPKLDTITHTTKIKNLKKKKVIVLLFDQRPFTTNIDHIKIRIEEPKQMGGDMNIQEDDYHLISWTLHLEPEGESTVVFKYSIEYPADRNLDESEQPVEGELRI